MIKQKKESMGPNDNRQAKMSRSFNYGSEFFYPNLSSGNVNKQSKKRH